MLVVSCVLQQLFFWLLNPAKVENWTFRRSLISICLHCFLLEWKDVFVFCHLSPVISHWQKPFAIHCQGWALNMLQAPNVFVCVVSMLLECPVPSSVACLLSVSCWPKSCAIGCQGWWLNVCRRLISVFLLEWKDVFVFCHLSPVIFVDQNRLSFTAKVEPWTFCQRPISFCLRCFYMLSEWQVLPVFDHLSFVSFMLTKTICHWLLGLGLCNFCQGHIYFCLRCQDVFLLCDISLSSAACPLWVIH